MSVWDNFWQALKMVFADDSEDNPANFWPDQKVLDHAKRDWMIAQKIFQDTSHPDLIDYAIYNLKAAEKRYMYLLKQLRTERREPAEFPPIQQSSGA